jgi:hypothetical protein
VILGRAPRVDDDGDATRAPLGILRANERREDTDRAEIDAVEVAIGASRTRTAACALLSCDTATLGTRAFLSTPTTA